MPNDFTEMSCFPVEVKSFEGLVSGDAADLCKMQDRFWQTGSHALDQLLSWVKKHKDSARGKTVCPLLVTIWEEARRSTYQSLICTEWERIRPSEVECLAPVLVTVSELLDFLPRLFERDIVESMRKYLQSDAPQLHTFFTDTQDQYVGKTSSFARRIVKKSFTRLARAHPTKSSPIP